MLEKLERNYLIEAIAIIRGKSMMLAEKKHLEALWLATKTEIDDATEQVKEIYG